MIAYVTDHLTLPLPEGHRFPVAKYRMLRELVDASGLFRDGDLRVPEPLTDAQQLRAHSAEYLGKLRHGTLSVMEERRIGFPWSAAMVWRARHTAAATLAACRSALADGVAVNLAGGNHHAFRDAGEGFCVFNDSAIAALLLRDEGLIERAVVLDCDVHQGNGTASILRDEPDVFTFSIHGEKNFPLRKEPSDLDIGLDDGVGDDEYLSKLEQGLFESLYRSRPDLAIYLAGADPYEGDRLGRLKLTKDGLRRRDEMVLAACRERGIPVAVSMAGGYAHEIAETAGLYFQTVRTAAGMG